MTAFFDTNILVYRLIGADPRKAASQRLLDEGGIISTQVLNEFASVARRKLKISWADIAAAVHALLSVLPPPRPLTVATHLAALRLAARYHSSFYDALIVAAALEAECGTLLSEDMQDGLRIDGSLAIRNPFA